MFQYDQDRDRFVPDRCQDPYTFYSVRHNPLNHLCIGSSMKGKELDFTEPFECAQRQHQQLRAFRQLRSYMSLESDGGHLLGPSVTSALCRGEAYGRDVGDYSAEDDDLSWPIRMVDQRRSARKSNTKSLFADLLLDMPNLSANWMTKILDWSSTGYLTAAIESSIHLWSGRTQCVYYTIVASDFDEMDSVKTTINCLKWDVQGEKLGYSFTVDLQFSDDSVTAVDTDSRTNETNDEDSDSETDAERRALLHARILLYGSSGRPPQNTSEGTADVNSPERSGSDTSSSDVTVSPNGDRIMTKNNYVKVWLLNGSNERQHLSTCGCSENENFNRNGCTMIVMDWLANGRIVVTGCTRGTVTFYKYDAEVKALIQKHVIHLGILKKTSVPTMISCMHVSQDKMNRHLAVASYSHRTCTLRVFRLEDPPELSLDNPQGQDTIDSSISMTESLTDLYRGKRDIARWVIKAFAWHPWKHSLMCYAVVSVNQDVLANGSDTPPSWFVLASACKGQVLRRVEQATWNACPTVKVLTVNTHSMTFSRITGELLVSTTTAYRVQKDSTSSPKIIEKHSVVIMHALNRIVETLDCSQTEKGLFFAWSPDGLRIALTSSDECLRIWNFWPTVAVKGKPDHRPRDSLTGATSPNISLGGDLNTCTARSKHNQRNVPLRSELSLDASRVIK